MLSRLREDFEKEKTAAGTGKQSEKTWSTLDNRKEEFQSKTWIANKMLQDRIADGGKSNLKHKLENKNDCINSEFGKMYNFSWELQLT